MLILPPLFKDSPASPFLVAYYPDCVGMSPSGSPSTVSQTELRADHCRAVQPQSKSVFNERNLVPRNGIMNSKRCVTTFRLTCNCIQHLLLR